MWMFGARLLSNVSSAVTIIVFLVTSKDLGVRGTIGAAAVSFFAVAVTVADAIETYKRRRKSFQPASPAIKQYLNNWIASGGRTAIVSRNLSWVDDEPTKELLRKKATARDLALYLPTQTEFVAELSRLGAEVHEYSAACDGATRSRFTIVNHGRGDARIAVGATVDGKHVVSEYGAGDPVLVLAEDLISRLARD